MAAVFYGLQTDTGNLLGRPVTLGLLSPITISVNRSNRDLDIRIIILDVILFIDVAY